MTLPRIPDVILDSSGQGTQHSVAYLIGEIPAAVAAACLVSMLHKPALGGREKCFGHVLNAQKPVGCGQK